MVHTFTAPFPNYFSQLGKLGSILVSILLLYSTIVQETNHLL
jgi:hypothetical protein